jgi:capsule biosynthesis phosphatase
MKRLIVDLDGTITRHADDGYENAQPNVEVIEKLREYKSMGFEIAIHTSRNMRTHQGNVGRINVMTLPIAMEWLKRHDVPFDEIHVGKPWCGNDGFYIDDKAIRPDEFVDLSYDQIRKIIKAD